MNWNIGATVLIVDDLQACITFYRDTLGFQETFSDDVSTAFKLAGQDMVLLARPAAANQISAQSVGQPQGARYQQLFLCAEAKDIDAEVQALTAKGVAFIKPPIDQPWGRRTAYFADPEGNLWELYQILDAQS